MRGNLRNLNAEDGIGISFESCTDLKTWVRRHDLLHADPDQSGTPPGFTRWQFAFDPENEPARFVRISASTGN